MAIQTRKIAYTILSDVIANGTYLNLALKERLRGDMPDQDARFISALCYTTLENLNRIDYIISTFTQGKRIHRAVRNALRLGVCQLMYFESVPESAAVNESVKLLDNTNKRQRKGFVNAVLRQVAKQSGSISYPTREQPAKYLSVMYSYPEWLCEKYISDYGFDFAEEMLSYKKEEAYTCVRFNPLKCSREEFENKLDGYGFEYRKGKYVADAYYIKNIRDIEHLKLYTKGELAVQSEASMLCVLAADIKGGQAVLDVCAAPGGKSAYAATFAPGKQVARDIHPHRVEMMEKNLKRLGADEVCAQVFDATQEDPGSVGKYDRVLIDAPCSALGLLYRKPDIKFSKTREGIEEIQQIQESILAASATSVAVGGRLIYSTCTIDWEENQGVVEKFLEAHKEFAIVDLSKIVPERLMYRVSEGMIQLYPHIDETDGFFIAVLERKA